MNKQVKSAYKPPSVVVLVKQLTDKSMSRLYELLRVHGAKGLKIIVESDRPAQALEALRDFLFSNYAFTVEVYIANPGRGYELASKAGSLVAILE